MTIRSGERFARVGRLELCYETFGEDHAPPLLLVMGFAGQMVLWDDEFCAQLAQRGFWVIRFDNRDSGRSTILREAPVPTRRQLLRLLHRVPAPAPYSLEDMALDAAGLLDHLEVREAHVVGASMGGRITQLLAIHRPTRVLSLVSIMSSTGSRRVGGPHPLLWPRLFRRPPLEREGYIEDFVATFRAVGSRRYPVDPERTRKLAARCFNRGYDPAGSARQLAAILARQTTRSCCGRYGPDGRDPWRRRSACDAFRRSRDRAGDSRCSPSRHPRDGAQRPTGALAAHHRTDRRERRARPAWRRCTPTLLRVTLALSLVRASSATVRRAGHLPVPRIRAHERATCPAAPPCVPSGRRPAGERSPAPSTR